MSTRAHPRVGAPRRALSIATAVVVIASAVLTLTSVPASAATTYVRQGETQGFIALLGRQGDVTVNPASAGTIAYDPVDSSLFDFTASTSYLGDVTLTWTDLAFQVQTRELVVIGDETSLASGSFIPVAAPGPCIVLTNATVSFGEIAPQNAFVEGDVAPTLSGCAPENLRQDIYQTASDASNGTVTLDVDVDRTLCPTPVNCEVGAGTFAVKNGGAALGPNEAILGSTPVFVVNVSGAVPSLSVPLFLKLPTALAPEALGSEFSFDVVFTATVA